MLSQKLAPNYGTGLFQTCFFSPQNGGEGSPAATERASSLQMLPTFKSGDERKARPTELHPVGGTLGNKVQDGGEGDGSLPCTPELQPDGDTDSQAGDEALVSDTKLMMMTFLRDYVGKPKARRKTDKVQETMRRVVDGVLEKHQYAYNGR